MYQQKNKRNRSASFLICLLLFYSLSNRKLMWIWRISMMCLRKVLTSWRFNQRTIWFSQTSIRKRNASLTKCANSNSLFKLQNVNSNNIHVNCLLHLFEWTICAITLQWWSDCECWSECCKVARFVSIIQRSRSRQSGCEIENSIVKRCFGWTSLFAVLLLFLLDET